MVKNQPSNFMAFLYANDRIGTYPNSWYAATSAPMPLRPAAKGDISTDVCVIGGGFTGLSAALHLAQRGYQVAVLEAHRAGFGASGRNGGQVGSGLNKSQEYLEGALGAQAAHQVWQMTQDAKALVHDLVQEHAPEAGWNAGVAHACYHTREMRQLHRETEHLRKAYGYDKIEPLERAQIQDVIKTKRYAGGQIDWGAGHLHPLRYALGLACAAEKAGAVIYEKSAVLSLDTSGAKPIVKTQKAQVRCSYVVHATNGYHTGLSNPQAARVLPINNYLLATAPLKDPAQVLTQNIAVADSLFVLNYYRLSHDNRLIFGGGESYGAKFPSDIFAKVRRPLERLFPQLTGIPLTHAWGGTLGITPTRLPLFARTGQNIFTAAGYSGHGVAFASFAGKVLAQAIAGQSERFDVLSQLPIPAFPGGQKLRAPIMTLAMTWFALRDKLGL